MNKYFLSKKSTKLYFLYLKYILVFACVFFLGNKILENKFDIFEILKLNYRAVLFVFLFSIIFQHLTNVRHFFLLKYSVNYFYSFLDWTKLFFYTALLNKVIFFSGHVYRAVELKNRGIVYKDYLSLTYVSFVLGTATNLLMVFLGFVIINERALLIFYFPLAILAIFLIYVAPRILYFFLKYFLKNILIYKKKYKNIFLKILSNMKKFFFNKKNSSIFILLTIIIFLVELILFYLSCTIFLSNYNFMIILMLFLVSLILARVPFISNIPGLNEIIFGSIGISMGIFFLDGALVQLLIRINIYLSVIFNTALFSVLSIFDKNKFTK
jgi:hypothetical protein